MSTFVLIHGGWAGGWYWERLVPELQRAGHRVLTLDLPGHGDDRTPWPRITLESYVERAVAAVDAASGPVILVGHSSGGVVVAQACERRPEKVEAAVYVCAFLPADGESLFDLGRQDRGGLIFPNLVVAERGGTATVRGEVIREALFADCREHDCRRAVARFRPEPLGPATTPVSLTGERFGRVPRVYVECRADRAVSPDLQRQMYTATPCAVVSLPTGHSPQYAAPALLASHLNAISVPPGGTAVPVSVTPTVEQATH